MKKLTALLLALLLCAQALPALAEAADETALVTEAPLDEGNYAEDDSEWLFEDDADLDSLDEEAEEDWAAAELAAEDDGAPITQVNESDQEDLLGAMEVYSWFALQPLDYDEDHTSPDGTQWRVLDERFNTPELLRDMLEFYFSDEIVDQLLNSATNPYTEIDGYLYTDGEGREIDENVGETSVEVTEKTDDTIRLTATVQYIEPQDGKTEESFDYVRKLINGEWRYTEFPFFW